MLKQILDILHSNDLYGVSESVEIAKGKYQKIYTLREAKEKIKRVWLSKNIKK